MTRRSLLLICVGLHGIGLAALPIARSAENADRAGQRFVRPAANTSARLATSASSRKVDCPPVFVPRPISEVPISLAPMEGNLPPDCAADKFTAAERRPASLQRGWAVTLHHWEAPALCHNPLYFEDVPLERYGQTHCPCLQPLISGAQFYGTIPLLPYLMTLHHPHECQYNLGYYRPGSPAPCTHPWIPLEFRAASVEAATIAGLILLFP